MFYLTFKIYVTVFTSIPLKALAHYLIITSWVTCSMVVAFLTTNQLSCINKQASTYNTEKQQHPNVTSMKL